MQICDSAHRSLATGTHSRSASHRSVTSTKCSAGLAADHTSKAWRTMLRMRSQRVKFCHRSANMYVVLCSSISSGCIVAQKSGASAHRRNGRR
jgi:hypothetical protein